MFLIDSLPAVLTTEKSYKSYTVPLKLILETRTFVLTARVSCILASGYHALCLSAMRRK